MPWILTPGAHSLPRGKTFLATEPARLGRSSRESSRAVDSKVRAPDAPGIQYMNVDEHFTLLVLQVLLWLLPFLKTASVGDEELVSEAG
ncbi:unnamed protein product [Caretta caretta]